MAVSSVLPRGSGSRAKPLAYPRIVAIALALGMVAFLDGAAEGARLGMTWERTFSAGEENRDGFQLTSARRLVDGSLLAVVDEGFGAGAFRFGPDGTLLTTVTFSSSGIVDLAAADSFGSVVIVSDTGGNYTTDLLVMKFDGLTGRKAWPSAARIPGTLHYRSGVAAAIGPSGNVFVAANVLGSVPSATYWSVQCYDARTGAIVWGPQLFGDGVSSEGGPVDLAIDLAGDLVVTGFAPSSEHSLWASIKYSGATGATVWGPRRIGAVSTAPPPTVCPGSCFSPPTFAKCAFDRKGNVFLTVSSFTAAYGENWLTAKYDGITGDVLWGPVSHKAGTDADYDVPSAIAVNGNGDVVVAGSVLISAGSGATRPVTELVKYRGETGEILWGPAGFPSQVSSLTFDGGGQVIVGATGYDAGYRPLLTGNTSKLDGRSGARIWSQPLDPDGPDSSFAASFAVVGPDGNVASLGSRYVGSGVEQHSELRAVNYAGGNGSVVWGPIAARNSGAPTWPLALLVDARGDTVLMTSSGGPGAMLKYSSGGRDLWGPVRVSDASSPVGWPAAACLDSNGDVLVARSNLLSRYSGSSGKLLWETSPDAALDSQFLGVKTNSAGDVLMAAMSTRGWTILKFRGATGERLWSSSYQWPSDNAGPEDFEADSNGDVFVTGYQWENERTMWVTVKYSGTTGDPIWGPVLYRSPHFGSEVPGKLAVDRSGDLIITGISGATGTSRKTIKYSGKDGAVVWGPSEFGTGRAAIGAPTAIAVDASGDIFIAGARSPQNPSDSPGVWSTVKIRGKTGDLVWGPKDFTLDRSGPVSISIDEKGNPAVVGAVREGGGTDQWVLIGYDSSTGDILLGPETYDPGDNTVILQLALAGADIVIGGGSGRLARTVRYGTSLGIATLQEGLAPDPLLCGSPFSASFAATNGKLPLSWEVSTGMLPPGLDLDPLTGSLSGSPSESGSFMFGIRARDAAGAEVDRSYTIDVLDGGPNLTIQAIARDACLPGQYTLSIAGSFASYTWLPGGETTPEITVCPFEPTIYSVTVVEPNGCRRRGSVELQPFKIELVARAPLAPPPRRTPRKTAIPIR